MSLFPFLDLPATEYSSQENAELPLFKEYAWDFKENDFVMKNGKPVVVEGLEAVKVWAEKALVTERYRYTVYSWAYGQEFDGLVGSAYSKSAVESECKRYLRECLLINPYIKEVDETRTSFEGDLLCVDFTLETVYGKARVVKQLD